MAFMSGIFPDNNGDRKYTTLQLAAFKSGMMSTGVYVSYLNNLAVTKVTDTMKTQLDTGGAIINGYDFINDAPYQLTHDAADLTNPRIDIIALRLNLNPDVRSITPIIIKGTPAASPAAPNLTQNSTIYDLPLAQIQIPANVTTLNTATLTDKRVYAGAHTIAYETGSYAGDGQATRIIPLARTPMAVLVFAWGYETSGTSAIYGGLATPNNPITSGGYTALEIVSGGFKVGYNTAPNPQISTNNSTVPYKYIAFY